jgi:acetyltransferase-like isoleucine patch superfamily enzyme
MRITESILTLFYFISHKISALIPLPSCVKVGCYTYGLVRKSFSISDNGDVPKIVIGNYCSFGKDFRLLYNVNHPTDLISTFPFKTNLYKSRLPSVFKHRSNADSIGKGATIIGSDVWFGERTILLSGVSVGVGSVIAAGSVVTKDVPPYAVVAGNPARIIKYRFTKIQIDQLLNSRWWECDSDTLFPILPYIYSNDVESFVYELNSVRSSIRENFNVD